ncbi:MAG: hypothetical protein LBJ63_07685 [Prevotellaceae bacterium]|jgi:hypothetical protein|nr:hypothetical protein [Prevotellaceae bacterium]
MAKCRKCGDYVSYRGICPACLKKFTDTREENFNKLQEKYGKLSPENIEIIRKEMRKLERKK